MLVDAWHLSRTSSLGFRLSKKLNVARDGGLKEQISASIFEQLMDGECHLLIF